MIAFYDYVVLLFIYFPPKGMQVFNVTMWRQHKAFLVTAAAPSIVKV